MKRTLFFTLGCGIVLGLAFLVSTLGHYSAQAIAEPHQVQASPVLVGRMWMDLGFSGPLTVDRWESAGCSSSISYGSFFGSYQNSRSGSGYSGCNRITVYEGTYHTGAYIACYAGCASFGAINDEVRSYRLTQW